MQNPTSFFVTGYYGAGNFGDEAILYTVLDTIREQYNSPDITVESVNPKYTESEHGVSTVPRIEQSAVEATLALLRADVLIIGGGTMINPRDDLRLATLSSLAKFSRTEIIWFYVGVQPPETVTDERLYSQMAKTADRITVREDNSMRELSRLGVSDPIDIIPDPVFDISAIPRSDCRDRDDYIAVVIRTNTPTQLDTGALADALNQVADSVDADLLFVPYHDTESDWQVINEVRGQLTADSSLYEGDLSVSNIHGITADARLVIGMRLHSIIAAAANDTPFVTLSYQPKCDRVANQIGDNTVFDCSEFDSDHLGEVIIDRFNGDDKHLSNAERLKEQAGDISLRVRNRTPSVISTAALGAMSIASITRNMLQKYR